MKASGYSWRLALVISLLSVTFGHADKVKEFRKRMLDLKNLKEKCDGSSGQKQLKCLDKYEKDRQEYQNDLASYKANVAKERLANMNEERGNSGDLQSRIEQRKQSLGTFLDFVKGCRDQSARCASALYQVANLTYLNEEESFLLQQQTYEKQYQTWLDNDQRGPEPRPIRRNHTESMDYFKRFLKEYPNHRETPSALTRLAYISDLEGKEDRSYEYLNLLVTRFPDHALTIPAHLRLGEYWLLKRKYSQAIEHYKMVPLDYGGNESALALYHRAEAYYNMADFETAARYYYQYVTMADNGKLKGDLRDEAMEFMAASYADMDQGFEVAEKFLRSQGYPRWADSLFFAIGEKNKSHDRLEESKKAFKFLLDKNPTYPDAPVADMHIVEILVIQKDAEDAQRARMEMVDRYRDNSAWWQTNRGNQEAIENANRAIKVAMYQIPIYHHQKGSKDKDNGELRKAEQQYLAYLNRFGGDNSWDTYNVHQNLAIAYRELEEYSKSADQYRWMADADISKFGKMPDDKKGMINQQDALFNMVVMLDKNREEAIKTAGGKEQAYSRPETRSYFDAVDEYMKRHGNADNAADIAYNAAFVHYEAKQYDRAITNLEVLSRNFPNHKHIKLIRRALGQSLLENGQYDRAEKEFRSMLALYTSQDKEYQGIRKSIASSIFKQADELGNKEDNAASAEKYIAMVNEFRDIDIAHLALFNAGLKYEKAGQTDDAVRALLRIHREYSDSSDLAIKGILRAAKFYQDQNRQREAAETFLLVQRHFPKDSMGFLSVGWAAESYDKANDKRQAAQTYELAHKAYPENEKTPGFLYNAGQIYESSEMWGEAIRTYELLGDKYPNSSYSVEGVFSVPLILEKRGDYQAAAGSYERFLKQYKNDPNKSIRAHLGAGKNYSKLGKEKEAVSHFEAVVELNEKFGEKYVIPSAIAAEAAFRAGDISYTKVTETNLNSSKKENAKRAKGMQENLLTAIQHFAVSAGLAEEEWTLRSTMRMGDLFRTVAEISKDEKIDARRADERIAQRVQITASLPAYYDKAKELYQKNLDLARQQGIQNPLIDTAGIHYLEMFWLKGQAFEDVGKILASAPLPDGLTPEERAEYKAALDDKAFEASQQAVPIYKDGLRAASFYALENPVKGIIKTRLSELEPEAEELQLQAQAQPQVAMEGAPAAQDEFRDAKYQSNMARIQKIYGSSELSMDQKLEYFTQMEAEAKREINRLSSEIAQIGQ